MYLKIILLIWFFRTQVFGLDGKPIIQDLLSSSKVIENESLFLSCQVAKSNGKLHTQFKWELNGKEIRQNENIFIDSLSSISILNIKSMTLDFAGNFKCTASNEYGSDSRSINLNLKVKPKWIGNQSNELSVKLNTQIEIDCDAFAVPVPQIKIQKLSNGRFDLESNESKLKVNYTKSSPKMYRCTAENELGSIQKEIKIRSYGNILLFFNAFGKFF